MQGSPAITSQRQQGESSRSAAHERELDEAGLSDWELSYRAGRTCFDFDRSSPVERSSPPLPARGNGHSRASSDSPKASPVNGRDAVVRLDSSQAPPSSSKDNEPSVAGVDTSVRPRAYAVDSQLDRPDTLPGSSIEAERSMSNARRLLTPAEDECSTRATRSNGESLSESAPSNRHGEAREIGEAPIAPPAPSTAPISGPHVPKRDVKQGSLAWQPSASSPLRRHHIEIQSSPASSGRHRQPFFSDDGDTHRQPFFRDEVPQPSANANGVIAVQHETRPDPTFHSEPGFLPSRGKLPISHPPSDPQQQADEPSPVNGYKGARTSPSPAPKPTLPDAEEERASHFHALDSSNDTAEFVHDRAIPKSATATATAGASAKTNRSSTPLGRRKVSKKEAKARIKSLYVLFLFF